MLKSKYLLSALLAVSSVVVANAAVTFTGTALLRVPNISSGDVSYLIIDETNTGFANVGSINPTTSTFVPGTIFAGTSVTAGTDNLGSAFTIVGSKTATTSLGATSVNASYANIPLTNGVDSGDKFAIIVFQTSTGAAEVGDTYRIYTDPSWVVPSDGAAVSFAATGSNVFLQLGTTASPAVLKTVAAVTVIPEPSTFAALAGVAVLGLAALRRRRA